MTWIWNEAAYVWLINWIKQTYAHILYHEYIQDGLQGPQKINTWLWKKELGRSKKQEKELEYKVLKLNTGETKNSNNKFFKGTCKNFGKYGHKATGFWGNKKKYKWRTRFSGEYNNCLKKGHSGVDCWAKKIEKEDE